MANSAFNLVEVKAELQNIYNQHCHCTNIQGYGYESVVDSVSLYKLNGIHGGFLGLHKLGSWISSWFERGYNFQTYGWWFGGENPQGGRYKIDT